MSLIPPVLFLLQPVVEKNNKWGGFWRLSLKLSGTWVASDIYMSFSPCDFFTCCEAKVLKSASQQSAHTHTGAPVQPQILLAVQTKEMIAWRKGRCPQMELSLPLSLPQMDPITPISFSYALYLHNQQRFFLSDLFIFRQNGCLLNEPLNTN